MSFFDKDEAKKLQTNFWNDGQVRRVTLTKEWRPGKADPTKEVCWLIAYDVDEKKQVTFCDFALLNALKTLPDGNYENAIIKVTPTKTGERVYNEKTFDVLSYTVEATGEFAEARVDVKDVGF